MHFLGKQIFLTLPQQSLLQKRIRDLTSSCKLSEHKLMNTYIRNVVVYNFKIRTKYTTDAILNILLCSCHWGDKQWEIRMRLGLIAIIMQRFNETIVFDLIFQMFLEGSTSLEVKFS